MAQSQSGFDREQYRRDLDEMMSSVMPDSWLGHARLEIAGRGFSEPEKEKILQVSKRVSEKKGVSTRKAAKAAIKKIHE